MRLWFCSWSGCTSLAWFLFNKAIGNWEMDLFLCGAFLVFTTTHPFTHWSVEATLHSPPVVLTIHTHSCTDDTASQAVWGSVSCLRILTTRSGLGLKHWPSDPQTTALPLSHSRSVKRMKSVFSFYFPLSWHIPGVTKVSHFFSTRVDCSVGFSSSGNSCWTHNLLNWLEMLEVNFF